MIVTFVGWIVLAGVALPQTGYQIKSVDSIRRHLYTVSIEATVLCVSLFGNVLTWMAFGFGRKAYLTVRGGGGEPKSGHAMET